MITTLHPILERAANVFDLPLAAIPGRSRERRVVEARQAVCLALRRDHWTVVAIGELIGRDHTTVIYSVQAAERRAVESPEYALDLLELIGGSL